LRRPFPTASLRLNLLAWLVVPGILVLAGGAWLAYGGAVRQANLVMDRQLTASARMMAEAVEYADGALQAVIPPAALELFASDSHDEVAYAVLSPTGTLLAGYPGLAVPDALPDDSPYFSTMFRTEVMRATLFRQPVVTPIGSVGIAVIVGETLKARDELVQNLWLRGFLEEATLVVAGALFIWLGINRELRPLVDLRQAVVDRPADRFDPFETSQVQSEVRPLVEALNGHMERLRRQFEKQRRFLDSAAHQLRTPLAIMKTQVGYARRVIEPTEVGVALGEVDVGLTAMTRLTNQLLALGGVEHERGLVEAETIDLSALVRETVSDASRRALDAGVELGFDGDPGCLVVATPLLVREMVSNLIDNVIYHAGPSVTASFAVRRVVDAVVLRVEDNGRGVEPEDRVDLLERFRRGRHASPGGSGLGLSIVAEVADVLGGAIEFPSTRGDHGFCVLIRLPVAVSRDGHPATSAG